MIESLPLRRSSTDAWLGGVLGGLAERWGISASRLRLAYAVISLLSAAFPGMFVYLVLWLLIPPE